MIITQYPLLKNSMEESDLTIALPAFLISSVNFQVIQEYFSINLNNAFFLFAFYISSLYLQRYKIKAFF